MNDVKSNEMVLASELELRGAVLKFRDPGTGDSEEEDEEIREGFMMSVSVEKDELPGTKEPSKSSFWRVESSNGKSRCRMVEEW